MGDLGVIDTGWSYDPDYQWGAASSPIICRNLVIVQCDQQLDSFIAAYDIRNGHLVWKAPRNKVSSWGTPTVYEGKVRAEVIANAANYIRGYDPLTGDDLWRLAPNSETTAPTPIAAHDLIFVKAGYRPIRPIFTIRPGATGDISLDGDACSNEHIAWSRERVGPYITTPIVYGNWLCICTSNGVLTVYDARTGERIYKRRLADEGGSYSASPVAANGKIYFTSCCKKSQLR
jgi:outer membrane protein assembly factor BamB